MGLNFKDRNDDDDFDSASYVRVNDRLREFWEKYPQGAIRTQHEITVRGVLVMTAKVYRDANDMQPAGTGHAFLESLDGEKVGEFTETVAVGRALAMMGFKVEKSIATGEEMKRFDQNKKAKKISKLEKKVAEATKETLTKAAEEINTQAQDSSEVVTQKDVEEMSSTVKIPDKLKPSGFNLAKIRKTTQQQAE